MSLNKYVENCKNAYDLLKKLNENEVIKDFEPHLESIVKDIYQITPGNNIELIQVLKNYKDFKEEDKTTIALMFYKIFDHNKMIKMEFQDSEKNILPMRDVIIEMKKLKEGENEITVNNKKYALDNVEVVYKKLDLDDNNLKVGSVKKRKV